MANILKLTILFLFLTSPFTGNAQQSVSERCKSARILKRQLEQDPTLYDRLEQMERLTARTTAESRGVVVIPVVVHILHSNNVENISDAQILSQIAVLNQDFRKSNADIHKVPSLFANNMADCEIQFQLAARDPRGQATNGICRYRTQRTHWLANEDMKRPAMGGVAAWNTEKYLNFWVCNIGDGTLGYAQFPGGERETDGIVIDYRCFGTIGTVQAPYHLGRTATHEVGHYLNLQHIWGDSDCGDDHVADTPTQAQPNNGIPAFPHYSHCEHSRTIDMFMNFMDYVHDEAMNMFTQGQKVRMQAVLSAEGLRAGLATSDGCKPPANYFSETKPFDNEWKNIQTFSVYPNPVVAEATVEATTAMGFSTEVKILDMNGNLRATQAFSKGSAKMVLDVSALPTGVYLVAMLIEGKTVHQKINVQKY